MKFKLFGWVIFIAVAVATNLLVQFFALSTVNVLEVTGKFSPGTSVYMNSSNGIFPVSSKTQAGINVLDSEQSQTLIIQLQDRLIGQYRLDVLHKGKPFELQGIQYHSNFSANGYIWDKSNIESDLEREDHPNKEITSYHLRNPVEVSNLFLFWVVPCLLGLMVVLFVRSFDTNTFPLLFDLRTNQQNRNAGNLTALDGFRGIAALVVLMHHATVTFKGWGDLGVWMFFVLSGFLLTRPFVVDPGNSIKLSVLGIYMTRRFKRIVPMYFFMITAAFLLQGHYDTAIRHYLFVQGDGHYWTILQEMYFYLLLPVLAMVAYFVCRGRPILSIVMLGIAGIAWNQIGSKDFFFIYGLNNSLRWFVEVFLIGMMGAYWYHGVYLKSEALKSFFSRYQWIFSITGIAGLVLLMDVSLSGGGLLGEQVSSKQNPILFAMVCICLLLLAVTGNNQCWYKKILSNSLLRCIGIVGYSFYLIHPYAIFITRNAIEYYFLIPYQNVSDFWLLSSAFVITLVFSAFTYSFIERPFLKKSIVSD